MNQMQGTKKSNKRYAKSIMHKIIQLDSRLSKYTEK